MQHKAEESVYFTCVAAPDEETLVPRSHQMAPPSSRGPVRPPGPKRQTLEDFLREKMRQQWLPHSIINFVDTAAQGLTLIASSGAAAAVYRLLKMWITAKNGRKLKIKVGDIEVEATQMKEEKVLRIFELLQKSADRDLIRKMLLEAVKADGRPEAKS